MIFDRVWKKINKDGPINTHRPDLGKCWLWTGAITGNGYGNIRIGNHSVPAHKYMYQEMIGKVPEKLDCDHLCRVRSCVNPHHIEPKTRRENSIAPGSLVFNNGKRERLKTHCPSGHQYTPENTRVFNGSRYCKECTRAYDRKRSSAKRLKLKSI